MIGSDMLQENTIVNCFPTEIVCSCVNMSIHNICIKHRLRIRRKKDGGDGTTWEKKN